MTDIALAQPLFSDEEARDMPPRRTPAKPPLVVVTPDCDPAKDAGITRSRGSVDDCNCLSLVARFLIWASRNAR